MSLPYYTKMLKELWKNGVLTQEEASGKDVLLIGLSYSGSELISILQQPFFSVGAKVE